MAGNLDHVALPSPREFTASRQVGRKPMGQAPAAQPGPAPLGGPAGRSGSMASTASRSSRSARAMSKARKSRSMA